MAEFGAHLTGTGGGDEGDGPSIFEVLAQENLMASLRPAVKYAVKVIAESNPGRYGRMYGYSDEIYTMLDLVLQNYYLKHYSSSFAENFYGMKRIPVSNSADSLSQVPLMLSRKNRLKSLLFLVMVPYVKHKCDNLYNNMRDRDETESSQSTASKSYLLKLCDAFLVTYPILHLVYEGAIFVSQLLYVFDKCGFHSPLLWLAAVRLRNLTEQDIEAHNRGKEPLNLSNKSFPRQVLAVLSRGLSVLAVGLSSSLSVGVFFLQFLEWWYASDQHATSLTALPTPPPPKPHKMESLPALASVCPLCNRMRTNDTVLAVTGYVFCYPCIYSFIRDHHQCPVTGYPANLDHLTKLYLEDT